MIDCPRCGALNATGRKRCVRCQAWLPVTLPNVEVHVGPLTVEAPVEVPRPLADAVLDYSQSEDKGGATLVHRPESSSRFRSKAREVPFDLVEEDVFTSAELADELSPPPESRSERTPPPKSPSPEKPATKRRHGEPQAATSGRAKTPPPLPTREIATVVRKISRPDVSPTSGGAVAYIPGKGIVPLDAKANDPPAASKGAASTSSAASTTKPRGSAPVPPPIPITGTPEQRASDAAQRLKAAVKAAVRARAEGLGPPDEAPTLVSSYPSDPGRDLGDVARLGALFTQDKPAEPLDKPQAEAPPMALVETDKGVAARAPEAERVGDEPDAAQEGPREASRVERVVLSGDGEPDAVTRTEVGAITSEGEGIKLERLDADGSVHTAHRLEQGRHIIGRQDGEILLQGDKAVSPWHAQLLVRAEGLRIKDMGALNGVHVRIEGERRLQDKDSMLIGGQRFIFRSSWDPRGDEDTVELGGEGYADPTRLLLKRSGGEVVGVYFIGEGLTIGRTRGELIFGADERMADEHAVIRRKDGGFAIRALSPRGVLVSIREEVALSDGQTFQLGRTLFRVSL